MWIAQWPDGTRILYRTKPRVKMGGWDGEAVRVLSRSEGFHSGSWRDSLVEVKEHEV
ncbi:hypothetical protein PHB09_016 [Pseudomonas phage PHB09]|uniref:Uncharacterized protein n=1 Tax=Pseudomonas phage PHB09 TaxID=2867265 RepID=A0AAE8XC69_9CAUD|nr:hypothetical protein QGX10_gp016 [Pseudomonas phage PHB09]UAV84512.1 hypothetical protein PHB09_016 [Pseudomonas phage PHB09]